MKSLCIAMLACAVVLTFAVSATVATEPVSVGKLVQEIATLRGLPAGSPVAASGALRDAGVPLPDIALDEALTEGSVVQISAAFGVNVRTSQPAARFDADRMNRFLLTMGREFGRQSLRSTGSSPEAARNRDRNEENNPPFSPGADPLTKGKGKKKGLLKRSPVEPG
jgi:hypothetical protein